MSGPMSAFGQGSGAGVAVAPAPRVQVVPEPSPAGPSGPEGVGPTPAPTCAAMRVGGGRQCHMIPRQGERFCGWHRRAPRCIGLYRTGMRCRQPARQDDTVCGAHRPQAPALLVPMGELLKLAAEFAALSEEVGEQSDAPEFVAWVHSALAPPSLVGALG
jgi:hypothetical protein